MMNSLAIISVLMVTMYGCVRCDDPNNGGFTAGIECSALVAEDVTQCLKDNLPTDLDASKVTEYGCCMMYHNHACAVKHAKAKCGTEDYKLFKSYEDEKRDNSFEECKDYQQCNHGYHSLPNAILLLISTLLVEHPVTKSAKQDAKCSDEAYKEIKSYEDERRDKDYELCKHYQQCNHSYQSLPSFIFHINTYMTLEICTFHNVTNT
ncbi:unnamed protein product [Oppiella nova]|uniref:Uncharacterized protein n=1 Tax=Oppiella nova TaxID=334625 RepID=A0A7R9LKM9_9ACAR|nr:unnamed protein product [Oppiella nova]CAG2164583.1 unnamed protein product [Oppiella nova]